MKKLLIILMVVAMASFLFVGCLPGVTPDVEEEEEEEVPVVTAAEAVAAVKEAAIVLDLAVSTTAGDILTFLEALADTNLTGYTAANDNAYVAAAIAGNFSAVTTVALVNTAIAAVNTAATAAVVTAATAKVAAYEALGLTTDALIVIADASKAGTKEGATAAVAALPAGTTKTLLEARIAAQDLLITAASTITTVAISATVAGTPNALILSTINSTVGVTALVTNAAGVPVTGLTTGVTYAWSVISAANSGTVVHTAVIGDLAFSSTTIAAPTITKGNVTDVGDIYTIKVVATKNSLSVSDTATVTAN